jgi:hypothetical protein
MKHLIKLLTGILVFVSQAVYAATEISPGVLYQPGTKLKVSTIGLELAVPSGWQAILPQGSEALIMEPVGKVARMIISAVPQSDEQMVRQTMSEQLALDFQNQLSPKGKVEKQAGLYSQSYQVTGNNPQDLVGSAYGRLAESGLAVYVVMLEPAKQNMVPAIGKKLIKGMAFSTPKTEAQVQQEVANNIDWNNELRGRTLKYMYTGGGLSMTKKMNLCSNGSFSYSDSDSYASSDAVGDFSAYSQGGQSGSWQIKGNNIVLQWNDGSTSQYTLSRRYVPEWSEWGTFVDEERWFNVQNQVCQ